METIQTELVDGWKLIAHPDYTVFSNEKSYIVVQKDDMNEMIIAFSINNNTFSVTSCNWGLKFDFRSDEKTIAITTDPNEYEEDEDDD